MRRDNKRGFFSLNLKTPGHNQGTNQAGVWWEWRKISIRGLLVDPKPNNYNNTYNIIRIVWKTTIIN